MNNLAAKTIEGQVVRTINSREVAEMVSMRHSDLLEKIGGSKKVKGYVEVLENGKFRSQDFFIKDSYKSEGNNKTYDCYELTRKGCDMIANKITGEKGVLFTAAYVTKFEEMEMAIAMSQFNLPSNFKEALAMLITAEEEKELLIAENTKKDIILIEQAPKVEMYKDFIATDNLYSVNDIAKILAIKNMGKNNLYKWLRWNKIFMDGFEAYQKHVKAGHVIHRSRSFTYGKYKGAAKETETVAYFTPKGVEYLHKKLLKDGYATNKNLSTIIEELNIEAKLAN